MNFENFYDDFLRWRILKIWLIFRDFGDILKVQSAIRQPVS